MRILAIAALPLLLAGCLFGVEQSDHVKPQAERSGPFGLGTASDVEVKGASATKGEMRVVVPYFRVAFYTDDNPGGYTNSYGDSTVIRSKLIGVDNALLQRVTDRAFATFKAQMTSKGFVVLPTAALENAPSYRAFPGAPTRTAKKDEALFGPDAIYVRPTGMRGSDTSHMRQMEANRILKETGASVVDVTLYVSYLAQSFKKVAVITTGLKVGQAPMVTPGSTMDFYGFQASRCTGFCPNTVARAKIGQPIFSTEKIGELKNVTDAGDTATDVAVTALSWMTSRTKIRRTRRYELHADPVRYERVVTAVLQNATNKLINAVATGR